MTRVKRRIGKYRLGKRLGRGGFASVYAARDLVEDRPVALKIPDIPGDERQVMNALRRELRVVQRLDHPNVLLPRNAEILEGKLVIAFPLGKESLAHRLSRRLATDKALAFAHQLLDALAHAHEEGVLHCDVKPENVILFPDDVVRLADFGIARFAKGTVKGSGAGTLGYLAPEQAMGRPSFRSDVFSLALVVWRMLSGTLPSWPYASPLPGREKVRERAGQPVLEVLERALALDARRRFRDAGAFRSAFKRARSGARRANPESRARIDWREVRRRQFQREQGKALETRFTCGSCEEPVAEWMAHCPWCGEDRGVVENETKRPICCDRCGRGVRSDWRFCAHCYGAAVNPTPPGAGPRFAIPEGSARCAHRACRGPLPEHARYCPWCRAKVQQPYHWEGAEDHCGSCGHGTLPSYWRYCPACGAE
ncbi:MAG: serine/threonine-protein kinase [Planctomycetota bacterium]